MKTNSERLAKVLHEEGIACSGDWNSDDPQEGCSQSNHVYDAERLDERGMAIKPVVCDKCGSALGE